MCCPHIETRGRTHAHTHTNTNTLPAHSPHKRFVKRGTTCFAPQRNTGTRSRAHTHTRLRPVTDFPKNVGTDHVGTGGRGGARDRECAPETESVRQSVPCHHFFWLLMRQSFTLALVKAKCSAENMYESCIRDLFLEEAPLLRTTSMPPYHIRIS